MSIEGLVSFLMYTMLIVTPIMGSADTAMEMAESLGALQRILDLRAVTDQPMSHTDPITVRTRDWSAKSSLRGDVDFHNVSVKYHQAAGTREYALGDVSFSVPTGSWVAMTGPSGSGKSTILSLMEKFIVPTDGMILVDQIPLNQHDDDEYRRQVGYIEQSCPLFSGTVRDNLLLGRDIDMPTAGRSSAEWV